MITSPGVNEFIDLKDAPNSYVGQATKVVQVNAGETAVEFGVGGGGGVAWGAITGTLSDQTDLQTALDGKVDENVAIVSATKTKITYDAKGLVTAGADATTADISDSLNRRYVTDAQLTVIGNTSGTNTGDQTSIVGITGTKAQFDTAVTDGNFLYVGDVTQYTDEMAQDAVGTILTDSAEIDFTYNDGVPSITASIVAGSIDETKLDASVNASLDLADTSVQPADITGLVPYTGATQLLDMAGEAVAAQFFETTDGFKSALGAYGLYNSTNTARGTFDVDSVTSDRTYTMQDASGTVAFLTDIPSAGHTIQDEGTPLTQRANLNFVGAGVTVTDGGAGPDSTIVTISGGAGSFAVTETEVDFGTNPTTDATFTVTDAAITPTSKIMVTESGSTGTGRVASGDSLWDTITYACVPATGSFTLYARASGSVVGFRKLFYTYA